MSGTHFYLTLRSNASSDVFPDNKTTSYRVKLPQTIDLEGNWEVGLLLLLLLLKISFNTVAYSVF